MDIGMDKSKHIPLKDLEVYKLSLELSRAGWKIYSPLDWQIKKIMGDQFITATDSFGANISEGYSRYYYLDKVRFFYHARGSITEAADYWLELLKERDKINEEDYKVYREIANKALLKLQNFISAVYRAKDNTS